MEKNKKEKPSCGKTIWQDKNEDPLTQKPSLNTRSAIILKSVDAKHIKF
jgi:hypothetical protein